MAQIDDYVAAMRHNPCNVRFADLVKVCDHYFGEARQNKTSHLVYKTPWIGNPRVNIQEGKSGKAKANPSSSSPSGYRKTGGRG